MVVGEHRLGLEQDDTLSAEVVSQAETNWDASFAGMVTQIDIELTDDGIRKALTLGYLNSNSYCRPIIEQSMGVQRGAKSGVRVGRCTPRTHLCGSSKPQRGDRMRLRGHPRHRLERAVLLHQVQGK